MAKIKLTKSELKSQRDALKQFTRFLPTLQLKKQQLQVEMMASKERLRLNEEKENLFRDDISSWISLFGESGISEHISSFIKIIEVKKGRQNIAGVNVPVFDDIVFEVKKYDLFAESLWIDSAIKAIQDVIKIKVEHDILEEQYRLINKELRTTTQRVNLFEKVMIPECKANIRVIQIYLGDQQTAAVGRSKIAKRKMEEVA